MVEAMKALLLKERQEKLQLEIQLREEICNEMVEQMQQREQWCRYCWVAFPAQSPEIDGWQWGVQALFPASLLRILTLLF